MSSRLLIITEQRDFARLLEHHVSVFWPEAACKVHAPAREGMLHPAFAAAGYDVVILDHQAGGGDATGLLKDLLARSGFPPLLYFGPGSDRALEQRTLSFGARNYFSRERIDHRAMELALRAALAERRHQQSLWRARPETEKLYQFGPVTIRGQRFIRPLGAGGTSQVYLAESEKAGEIIVLKVLDQDTDVSDAHAGFDRFLQEYELVSRIRHPNVVRIHDLGIADDHAYLAMEYFPAGDLRRRLSAPLSVVMTLSMVEQMAKALMAVHSVGVLHRDLKPGNVMLRTDGSVALIDFGLAKQLTHNAGMTAAGEIFGTPYYMSPEQGHGEPVDARSDLYSLGVIFYEMLTRRKPYTASSAMGVIYLHRNAPLPELPPEHAGLASVVHRLLAKDPADRHQSAAELAAELARLRQAAGS